MDSAELLAIVQELRSLESDTRHIEVKLAQWALPRELWQTLSAFSNTSGGGTLILGLDERSGFVAVGLTDPAKSQADLASLCDEMDPPIRATITLHGFEGAQIVVAGIPEAASALKPCYYRREGMTGGAYIRVADGDRRLTPYEVQLLLAGRGQPREDERPVAEATLDDLDSDLLVGLLARLRRPEGSPFRTFTDDHALRALKVMVPSGDHLVPSLAGLLVLGRYPQQFFPGLSMTFVVYPELEVGQPGPGGERFLDNRRFEGPIPKMLRPALDALQRNMRRRSRVRGLFREDLWEYPETAIREALVNALGHRDLSPLSHGSPVQVQMFPDRMTVMNPGGLFGPVTVDRLGDIGISSSRNALLMKLLEDVTIPGEDRTVCENRGSGIGAMFAALREAGMSPPEFEDEIASFRLTFPNHSLLDSATLEWLETVGQGALTDSQAMALAILSRGGSITNAEYRRITGVDSRLATRELGDLVRRGILHQAGTRGSSTYRVASRLLAGADETTLAPRDRIMRDIRRHGSVSRAELEARLQMRRETAIYHLNRLIDSGLVERTTPARSPAARYRLRTVQRTE